MASSKEKLRVGIIGCGGIALGKHLPALSNLDSVELVAFNDFVEDRARSAAKEYGSDDAKVYTSYEALLEDKTVDVVHVLTPNNSHASVSIDALEAGKHVMCEKPMATNSADAKKMVEAAKRTGKKLTIGYQNRFRRDSQTLHKMCDAGELGDIYFAKALAIRRRAVPTWGVFLDKELQGGGPLIDIGTHSLDLTLWMMNNYKPKYVVGNVYHKLGQQPNAANAWGPWNPDKFEVEDSAFGFITMENGATIVLESSWALNTLHVGEARTVLCGTKGGADMEDGLRINGERYGRLYQTNVDLEAGGGDYYEGSKEITDAHLEAKLWIDAILNNHEPVVTPEQGLVVTQILEAIYQSSEQKKPIYF